MRSIPPPKNSAVDVFNDIANAKLINRQQLMRDVSQNVFSAYKRYENAAPEVGELAKISLNNEQKDAMLHAYTEDTKPMLDLRSQLREPIYAVKCPFCGIGESETLDHYLPKSQYPEFSVFPVNLVPSCYTCNKAKRDRILNENTGMRKFLHPYYDKVPDIVFLEVRVNMDKDGFRLFYYLSQPDGMSLKSFLHLQSHFNALNLADRYRRNALDHLGSRRKVFSNLYGSEKNAERVMIELCNEMKKLEDSRGPNFWLASLYRALANNQEFCDGGFNVICPVR